jgi:mono/diheme cytochrome c family protein
MNRALTGALIGLVVAGAGCRGAVSEDPPIHVIGDMDWQQKYLPEQSSKLFPDGRAMRPLVEGTVAQGQLREDDAFYRGKTADGSFIAVAPIPVDEATLRRGQDRFNIYCAPCHDQAGGGHGLVIKRGYPLPPNLADDRIRNKPDGDIFNTITNGNNNMPSYKKQIPVEDRWKIVTWVRVLGHSQHATTADVPSEQRDRIESESGTP